MKKTFELSEKATNVVLDKYIELTKKRKGEKVTYQEVIDILLGIKKEK